MYSLKLIPQVMQTVFPGGERGIGVEFVVDFYVFVDQHHNFVQEIVVYLGYDIYAGLQFEDELYAVLAGA